MPSKDMTLITRKIPAHVGKKLSKIALEQGFGNREELVRMVLTEYTAQPHDEKKAFCLVAYGGHSQGMAFFRRDEQGRVEVEIRQLSGEEEAIVQHAKIHFESSSAAGLSKGINVLSEIFSEVVKTPYAPLETENDEQPPSSDVAVGRF